VDEVSIVRSKHNNWQSTKVRSTELFRWQNCKSFFCVAGMQIVCAMGGMNFSAHLNFHFGNFIKNFQVCKKWDPN